MPKSSDIARYRPFDGQLRHSLLPYTSASCRFVIGVFGLLYCVAILYCNAHYFRDPTSSFWDESRGYERIYSLRREQEAEAFILESNVPVATPRIQQPWPDSPELCLGIATVARPKAQYIHKTVGSVLEGMNETERAKLHFIFFVAHTDLKIHPIHGDPWTENLPDQLLTYDYEDEAQLAKIKEWEVKGDHRNKAFYDYTYLMKQCKKTGAPYIAMLEGDVLAVPGWLERSIYAAEKVDTEVGMKGKGDPRPGWLYIRMFWTETYLGWNAEEWPAYLFWSGVAWILIVGGIIGVRKRVPISRHFLSDPVIILVSCICLPLSFWLYFAAGRISMQPPPEGVRRMENFGCCSQGMIFSAQQVPTIVDAIQNRLEGYMDMLLETLAERSGLQRWAIFPSLLQHIGSESSKGDAASDARAKMIWNFAFEGYGRIIDAGRALWHPT